MKKVSFKFMLKLFDEEWSSNRGNSWNATIQWRESLAKYGWTDEEFDKQLDTHLEQKPVAMDKVA